MNRAGEFGDSSSPEIGGAPCPVGRSNDVASGQGARRRRPETSSKLGSELAMRLQPASSAWAAWKASRGARVPKEPERPDAHPLPAGGVKSRSSVWGSVSFLAVAHPALDPACGKFGVEDAVATAPFAIRRRSCRRGGRGLPCQRDRSASISAAWFACVRLGAPRRGRRGGEPVTNSSTISATRSTSSAKCSAVVPGISRKVASGTTSANSWTASIGVIRVRAGGGRGSAPGRAVGRRECRFPATFAAAALPAPA